MRGIGYDEEEARIVTDHVLDAALCGYEYSGLAKLLNIPEHRRWALPRTPIRLMHETPVSALYDGGNNVGMLAMYHAASATIAKAAAHGRRVFVSSRFAHRKPSSTSYGRRGEHVAIRAEL